MPGPPLTAWYVGYLVVAGVVLLVAALVAIVLLHVRRAGHKVLLIAEELREVHARTAPDERLGTIAGELDRAAATLARRRAP